MAQRVMLVESDRLMLESLSLVVQKTEGFSLVARYQTANDALGQGVVFRPNLILLDSDNDNIVSMIANFKKVYPKASILCMSEKWQAESASHLLMAGAKGNIIKPFTELDLREAVSAFAKSGMETGCEILTFFSPKGKSGKTTLIANLGLAIARRTKEPVGIIDADLQFGDMAVFFNLEPASTIVEAVRDSKFLSPLTLAPYFVSVTENVKVLCGTRTPNLSDKVKISGFRDVIKMASNLFKYLLIDVPQGFNPTSIEAAELSTKTYVVAMVNDGFEIQHMQRALEIFKEWGDYDERVCPVFTRVSPCTRTEQDALSNKLGKAVDSIIPNDYQVVSAAADKGTMAMDIEPDSEITKAVNKMAQKIVRPGHVRWDNG